MPEFLMPKLGADMSAGTLVSWLKKPGDAVRRGDIVASVETDKGVIDVEIFSAGVIERLLVKEGQKVPVGTPLALLVGEGGPMQAAPPIAPTLPQPQPAKTTAAAVERPTAPQAPAPTPAAPTEAPRLRISPAARHLARALGVDPNQIAGTGPSGAITRDDVQRAAEKKAAAPPTPAPSPAPPIAAPAPTAADERYARMRQSIAAAMSRSKREIPHYYVGTTIDLFHAVNWLTAANEKRSTADRLLLSVLLLKAAALALREVPELNAVWEADRAVVKSDVHLGVAVSLRRGGLIAPALHHADQCTLDDLMHGLQDLVKRTRAGGLRSSELSDSTITVTNLGDQGVETVYGVIYPPQTAIVGFGKVVERPWSVQGQIVSRPVVTATLSADHRVSDGHRGASYLAAVDRLLQEPDRL